MAERIDLPPELAGEREALWRQHREGLKGNSTCYEFTAEDRKEIDRLRAMSPLECDREIGGAADRLGVTVGTLRMVLRDLRRNNGAGGEKQESQNPKCTPCHGARPNIIEDKKTMTKVMIAR